jgi:hypothetical protein
MAKTTTTPAAAPAARKPSTVAVTYRPLNPFDPNEVRWNGIKFLANVPVQLDPHNPAHKIKTHLATEHEGPEGETRLKHREALVSMIELAKLNPSFEVEGFPRAKMKKSKRVVPPPGAEWADTHADDIDQEEEAA